MREIGILYTPENIRALAAKRKWQTRRVIVPQPNHTMTRIKEIAKKPRYRVGDILYVKEAWRCTGGGTERNIIYKLDGDTAMSFCGVNDGRTTILKVPEEHWAEWDRLVYKTEQSCNWRSPMFMPKWAARPELKRRVTGVRVERVQDISEEDAIAEGIEVVQASKEKGHNFTGTAYWDTVSRHSAHGGKTYHVAHPDGVCCCDDGRRLKIGPAACAFRVLWDSISGKPEPVYQKIGGKKVLTHYISYPWQDIHETWERRGKPWYVCGNPYVFAYSFDQLNKAEQKANRQ